MCRKGLLFRKRLHRLKYCLLLLLWVVLSSVSLHWLSEETSGALLLPSPEHDLTHFVKNRDLDYYVDNIDLLIEPSSPCLGDDLLVVVLVTSRPSHEHQRRVIRDTWGKELVTYFVLGVEDDYLADNYIEAKQHSDMIVYNMVENYQNLTLKTMLMLHWSRSRCMRAQFFMKTDDDVLINPWMLETVLQENKDAQLLGYRVNNQKMHRNVYSKWFVPRWLMTEDYVTEYLTGFGYLINTAYLPQIYEKARKIPLMNLEDVYLTYQVAKIGLNLTLIHDERLNRYKPWLPLDCAYWSHAAHHSLTPREISHCWDRIERVHKQLEANSDVCSFYNKYLYSEWLLY